MAYKDIIVKDGVIPASSSGEVTAILTNHPRLTSSHVLLNDNFPPEFIYDINWETFDDHTCLISWSPNRIYFSTENPVQYTLIFGVPDN